MSKWKRLARLTEVEIVCIACLRPDRWRQDKKQSVGLEGGKGAWRISGRVGCLQTYCEILIFRNSTNAVLKRSWSVR